MGKAHARWHHVTARQPSAQTHQYRHKKLDLMLIRVSTNADIAKSYHDIFAITIFDGYAFINDGAVSRRVLQSRTQQFRGCRDIINQSNFSNITSLSTV